MNLMDKITNYSISHYKTVTMIMVIFTVTLGAFIPLIHIDTDPENMLSEDEEVRVFHNKTKETFFLSDIVVVGIVNNKHPNGVFNPTSLARIYELTKFAKTLRWPDEENPGQEAGVIETDILAPSEVDHISQGSTGEVRFEWLMKKPPSTEAEALQIRDKALSNPMLKGTLVSEDGKALCVYLPLTNKHLSWNVYEALREKIDTFQGDEEYHITGLPVAEDTFGVEMFIQMAISAPLAMLVIFFLMLLFFKKLVLIISPMIVAMVSVISTMGLLIGLGYHVHIMSSMIPIFLMPIAVVDSVHILSEFFDRYSREKGKENVTREVMNNLFMPMLYTSLTSAAGFASLALTPIPPVQVFGIFVAIGIMIAWICTITFVPAYIMMVREKSLDNFGHQTLHEEKQNRLSRLLQGTGGFTYKKAKPILLVLLILMAVAVYGITRIQINDNPVKWFSKSHPIRLADIELNRHFGGTYMAYLVLERDQEKTGDISEYAKVIHQRMIEKADKLKEEFPSILEVTVEMEKTLSENSSLQQTKKQFLEKLSETAGQKSEESDDELSDAWFEFADFFDLEKERLKTFKQPQNLQYISKLQKHLLENRLVGKSNSVADVVKKVYQELTDGSEGNYRIPDSLGAVAQCLMQFQSSHKPNDLWHLVTYDYSSANLWLQLTSGDNKDMEKVVRSVDEFFKANPGPVAIKHKWAGLTYINIVWQNKMVWGMLQSFMGSFLIVFIMMTILFRSPLWGLICMIPLTITILVIYGIIGLVGKDYDMPVAILSALTLGMSVDFAIHFLERVKASYAETGSWESTIGVMFGEPARAISRNVIVIAIGFLPLLAAPLIPYKTVGIFLCVIMALSGAVTLIALPSVIKVIRKLLFRVAKAPKTAGCNCALCIIISVSSVVLVAVNLHQYWKLGWNVLGWISIVLVPALALGCGLMSRRQACRRAEKNETQNSTDRKE